MSQQDASLAGWVLPLQGDNRCGVDARYDPGYELIRAELSKLDAVSAPPVDWDGVRTAADSLLRTRSKDLFVAAALARSLHVTEGLAGLASGISLLAQLIAEFGDSLYPVRARARLSALDWLTEQEAGALSAYSVAPTEREVLASLRQHFEQLAEGARALLADAAPSFSGLRDAIERMQLSLPEAPSLAAPDPPRDAPVATAQAAVATPPIPAPVVPVALARPQAPTPSASVVRLTPSSAAPGSASEIADYLSTTGGALTDAARLLWREDRTAPLPYRLLRTGLWLHLEAPPPHDAGGQTSIPAPDERLAESLTKMMQHGAWEQLLEISEATLASARFWLDLHLFCDRALEGLGPTFAAARAAATAGVRALLTRMPMLVTLSFSDGVPLARPETAAWLEQLMAAGKRTGPDVSSTDAPVDLEALRSALRGPAPAGALAALDEQRRACTSARQRFVMDLALARVLSELNQTAPARALFEALDVEARRHELESWEPALSLTLLTAYMRCLQKTASADESAVQGLQTLRVRVAKLSPAALVSLGD